MADGKKVEKYPERLKTLYETIDSLLSLSAEETALSPAFGTINFQAALDEIRNINKISRALKEIDLSLFPNKTIQNIAGIFQQALEQFTQIKKFSLSQQNPAATRDQIQNEIRSVYQQLFEKTQPIHSMLLANSELEKVTRSLEDKVSDIDERSKSYLNKLSQSATEAEATLKTIKVAAGQAGVSKEATHFATEASEHKGAAKKWASATIVVVLAAVAWGSAVLWWIPLSHDPTEIVQHTIGKIIVFTALYYALIWCARNYNASRHNYVVNKHKQNSLSTFESFVKAADQDAGIKNAVLLQATTSIFSSQVSGYAKQEAESEPPSKIIEILRSVSGKPS
jgi:hypothetical protein